MFCITQLTKIALQVYLASLRCLHISEVADSVKSAQLELKRKMSNYK